MGLRITGSGGVIENNIAKAQQDASESLERLSSGVRFTRKNPLPADRARSDNLSSKMKELSTYKKTANEGLSFTELADSTLNVLSNMTIRMKELANQATSANLSDKERQFLFVEYQSLYNEADRIAATTTYNGQTILDAKEGAGKTQYSFRVGRNMSGEDKDINVIKVNDLDKIKARPADLGLVPVKDLLESEDGVSLDDVMDTFDAGDINELNSSFDNAQEKIGGHRAHFGATTSRLNYAVQSLDVAYENLAAANSRIKDVDYATEVSNLTRANILVQAGSSLFTQRNVENQAILTLLKTLEK